MAFETTAAVGSLLIPWAVFTLSIVLLSFSTRYKHPEVCWFVVELTACLAVMSGMIASDVLRRWRLGSSKRDPTWHVFFSVSLALAWGLGVAAGQCIYVGVTREVFDITSLETYMDQVDPSSTHGAQMLDAGRVVFSRSSYVDFSRGIAYTPDSHVYCLAPIVTSAAPLASYDFWAVGVDCCTGTGQDFTCGEALNPLAHAATRVMDDGETLQFGSALRQAMAMNSIVAEHPLFFHWLKDPVGDTNRQQDKGLKLVLLGIFTHFGVQLFMVVVVAAGAWQIRAPAP